MKAVVAISSGLVMLAASAAQAGRCWDFAASRIIWCDDFDNYCAGAAPWTGGPPYPSGCPYEDATPDNAAMLANWQLMDGCGSNWALGVDPLVAFNIPLYAIYPGGPQIVAPRHAYDLTPRIASRSPGSDAINGSNAKPLVLRMMYNFMPEDLGAGAINYTELVLDNGDGVHAPTDYIWRGCGGESGPYPTICQQDRSFEPGLNAFCPPPAAGPLPDGIWPSLAVGPNALLDVDPCDAAGGGRPSVPHCSVFDGRKWIKMAAARFPGNGGDFQLEWQFNTIQLTIRTSSFDVELWGNNLNTGQDRYSKATVPRQYLGPFNRISHGMGAGCELSADNGACVGGRTCFDYSQTNLEALSSIAFDSPVLVDGLAVAQTGACCADDGTCSQVTRSACEAAAGRYHGSGTECGQVLCCPVPFADVDRDGDVDQEDFAWIQRCFTGPDGSVTSGCECFDRDSDRDVDGADVLFVDNCRTGPNLPWNAALTPLCLP